MNTKQIQECSTETLDVLKYMEYQGPLEMLYRSTETLDVLKSNLSKEEILDLLGSTETLDVLKCFNL